MITLPVRPSRLPRFILSTLACGALIVATAAVLRAETVQFPATAPIASFDVPSGWTQAPQADGSVVLTSGDNQMRLVFKPVASAAADPSSLAKAEADALAKSAKIDGATPNSDNGEGPHMADGKTYRYRVDGKVNGADTTAAVLVITLSTGKQFTIAGTMTDAVMKGHREVDDLMRSLKPVTGGTAKADPTLNFKPVRITPANTGSMKFPSNGSSIVMDVPTGWSAVPQGSDLRVQTDDKTLSVLFQPAEGLTNAPAQLKAMVKSLAASNGVSVDGEPREHTEKSKADESVSIQSYVVEGKSGGKDLIVVVGAIVPTRGQQCIVQSVIDPKAASAHEKEFDALMEGLTSAR